MDDGAKAIALMIALMAALILLLIWARETALDNMHRCEAAGGVYFVREGLCMHGTRIYLP